MIHYIRLFEFKRDNELIIYKMYFQFKLENFLVRTKLIFDVINFKLSGTHGVFL